MISRLEQLKKHLDNGGHIALTGAWDEKVKIYAVPETGELVNSRIFSLGVKREWLKPTRQDIAGGDIEWAQA